MLSDTDSDSDFETLKHHAFLSKPLGGKHVREIPGVGKKTAHLLNNMNYVQASDLYDVLKGFNFSEQTFRVWMNNHFAGAKLRVDTIYEALMEYHRHFGHLHAESRTMGQQHANNGDSNPSSIFCDAEPLAPFLMSLLDLYKNIPQTAQNALKMDMLSIVQKYERERQSQTV